MGRVGTPALGLVVLAAASAAEDLRGRADQRPSGHSGLTGPGSGRDDDDRAAVGRRRLGDDRGSVGADPVPDVEDEGAQVVGAEVTRVVGDQADAAEVAGAGDQAGRGAERFLLARGGDLPLGLLEPAEDAVDPLG